jgi:hypothetical protein
MAKWALVLCCLSGMAWGQAMTIVSGPGVACDSQPNKNRVYCHINNKPDTAILSRNDGLATGNAKWESDIGLFTEKQLGKWIELNCAIHWNGNVADPTWKLKCDGGKGATGSKVTP